MTIAPRLATLAHAREGAVLRLPHASCLPCDHASPPLPTPPSPVGLSRHHHPPRSSLPLSPGREQT